MANSIHRETIGRSTCFQMLEAVGCLWERQLELFHTQLAELDGPDRAVRLAELVVIEYERLFDQATCN